MPRLPRLTAQEAEKLLLDSGFLLLRIKGSHHIYFRDGIRVVIPFHSGEILHPKIIKQVIAAIAPDEQDNLDETLG
ncbi:MAG: type II toxin-antitoxin system HicA family toxin [Phormidesmis sp. CAN_BIN44]|nr:type II toxin-antitoxin system HicA family toxin [Phormidesmis sp. CAN_BIN44]